MGSQIGLDLERLERRVLLSVESAFSAGLLSVTADADDAIALTDSGGSVQVNGADPDLPGGPVASADITDIEVVATGDFDNHIDLGDLDYAKFPSLVNVTVEAGAGNDVIDSGRVDDTLDGGLGADVYHLFATGNHTVVEPDGDIDTLDFHDSGVGVTVDLSLNEGQAQNYYNGRSLVLNGSVENFVGSIFDDVVTGSDAANLIESAAGNDQVWGGDGDDTLIGGDGNDTLYGELGNDTMAGMVGDDSVHGDVGDDTFIVIPASHDVITDTGGTDKLDFHESGVGITVDLALDEGQVQTMHGSNTLAITGVIENVRGSIHDDTIYGSDIANLLEAAGGNDTVYGRLGDDVITGGNGDDVLYGGKGNDLIDGKPGDDTAYGEEGDDTLLGDVGDDTLVGGLGNDELSGNAGNDHLMGNEGDDLLAGNEGDDVLDGGADDDTMVGGTGNDTFVEVPGSHDEIADEAGTDTIDFSGALRAVSVDLGRDDGSSQQVDNAGNSIAITGVIENVIGSSFDDHITGNAVDNTVWGLEGRDIVFGREGNDTLYGGDGQDLLLGDQGDDTLYGGAMDDLLLGLLGHDTIWGGTGNDLLVGNEGDDTLYGEEGDDMLQGGSGANVMDGGPGDDLITGTTA